ncbi:MAG: hypothetical protein IKW74_08410, partial [Thermoguttaceae bacterium]|nr:hypothetical protein [Thermoguttaceae bacterium]
MTTVSKCCLLCLFLFAFSGSGLFAQYQEASVDDSLASQKNTVIASGDAGQLKDFMDKYYLARWTLNDNAQNLHKFREEVNQDASGLSGDAKKTFMDQVIDSLNTMALSKSYSPACRYNAALAIAMLNESSAVNGEGEVIPYPDAIKTLASFCTSKKEVPSYIRLAGLIGLERHAQLGIQDEKLVSGVKSVLLQILDPAYAKDKNLRPEIALWFQIKAVTGLTAFKTPKGKGDTDILAAFNKIIENSKNDTELRCLAARGIGEMNLESAPDYDYAALTTHLLTLCRDFCNDEIAFIDLENLRDQVDKNLTSSMGPGGMMGGGMMGGGMMGGDMGRGGD